MADKEWLKAQRQALGKHLRGLREAEDFTQGGLAQALELGRYERTSISHIEAGSQSAPRLFWQRADALLQASGTLLAGFDEFERAREGHSREQRRRERAAKSRTVRETEATWAPHLGDALVAMVSSWQPETPPDVIAPLTRQRCNGCSRQRP